MSCPMCSGLHRRAWQTWHLNCGLNATSSSKLLARNSIDKAAVALVGQLCRTPLMVSPARRIYNPCPRKRWMSCRTRASYEDSLTHRPLSVACSMRLFWPNADSRLAHSGVHRRSNLADLYRPVPNPDHSRGLIGNAGRNSGGPDDLDFRTGP